MKAVLRHFTRFESNST